MGLAGQDDGQEDPNAFSILWLLLGVLRRVVAHHPHVPGARLQIVCDLAHVRPKLRITLARRPYPLMGLQEKQGVRRDFFQDGAVLQSGYRIKSLSNKLYSCNMWVVCRKLWIIYAHATVSFERALNQKKLRENPVYCNYLLSQSFRNSGMKK